MKTTDIKLFAICDSPTLLSGFADVVRNIFGQFTASGVQITIWGIGFDGNDYWHHPQLKIIPAGVLGKPWHLQLGHALTLLNEGDYTHVWILNDLSALTATDFPAKLRHVCATKRIRSLLYFPVDAAQEPEWCEIINRVDEAVSYTHYGVREVRKAGCKAPVHVLPHGVDMGVYRPLADRKKFLEEIITHPSKNSTRQFATAEDFLILGVNKNEWRKDPFAMLQILAELKANGVKAKMILRMAPHSAGCGIQLETAGEALGLELDTDWIHLGPIKSEYMPLLYNAADLYLTTTLGEGWGLGITEALACGCPVAMPLHTACGEICSELLQRGVEGSRVVGLISGEWVFGPIDARLRRRVHIEHSRNKIMEFIRSAAWQQRPELPDAAKEWLHWPRVAAEMLKLMGAD